MALRQVSNNQQAFTIGDRSFTGIDTYNKPNKLEQNYFQSLQNLFVYGNVLRPRNGWLSVWFNPSGPNYNYSTGNLIRELSVLKDSGQASRLIFASGSNVYAYDTSAYTATPLTTANQPVVLNDRWTGSPINIGNANNVRMVKHGQYVYGVSGASNPMFRVRMNGSSVEAEQIPVLANTQLKDIKPLATTSPLRVMPDPQISNTNTAPILTSGFSSLNASLFATLVTNGNFSSTTASGFAQWNYNTTDVQYITSGTKTVGANTFNTFANSAKNPQDMIITRDGQATQRCLKLDQIQDFVFQDIDVRTINLTDDSELITYSVIVGALDTFVVAGGHGLSRGQKVMFSVAVGGLSTTVIYYVHTVVSSTQFKITTDSTLVGAVVSLSGATSNQTYKVIRNCGMYVLTLYLWNEDDLTNFISGNSMDVRIQGMKETATTAFAGTNLISGAEVYYNCQPGAARTANDWQRFEVLVDFRQYDKILTGLQVRISTAFHRGGDSYVLLEDVSLHAINSTVAVASQQDDPNKLAKLIAKQENTTFNALAPVENYAQYLANEYIKIDLGANFQFTESESLSIRASFPESINASVPPFSLGFRSGSKTEWTGQCSYDKDQGYLTFQLFPISQAFRKDVRYLYFRVDFDLTDIRTDEWFISFGEVTKQGALTPNSKYSYMYTLWKPYTLPSAPTATTGNAWSTAPEFPGNNGFETAPTQFSADVTITAAVNQVTLRLHTADLRRPVTNCEYKYALIYRKNVLFGDNIPRLVAVIDLDSGNAYSDGTKWTGGTASITDAVTREITYVDQVQDSGLLFDNGAGTRGYRFKTGRDQFPVGCSVLASFNNRLFAVKENTIYASWLLDRSNEYGLYTTELVLPEDVEASVKGASFTISSKNDEEVIQAMVPIAGDGLMRDTSTANALAIMREHSLYLLTGDDPTNFASQGYLQGQGNGLVAKRGACTVNGRLMLTTSSGVAEMTGTKLSPIGLALEGLLNMRSQDFTPAGYSQYINPQAYADIVFHEHDRRLMVLAPTVSETSSQTCTRCYVFDTRNNGWVNWTNPSAFTSIVSVEAADDTQELYAGGRDGRLYRFQGFADGIYNGVTGTRTLTDVSWNVISRAYGQTFAEGSMYYSANKIHSLNLHIENQHASGTLSINWLLRGMNDYTTGSTYTWPANNEKVVSLRQVSRTADRQTFNVELNGSSQIPFLIHGFHVTTTEGNTPRS